MRTTAQAVVGPLIHTTVTLHTYYTPKITIFQGDLYIFNFFVNYDDFYVNTVMSTALTSVNIALSFSTILLHLGAGCASVH